MTIAATSAWGRVKETAAAVSVVTIWRPEPAWSALSAKMVSCQLSYLQDCPDVFICFCVETVYRQIKGFRQAKKHNPAENKLHDELDSQQYAHKILYAKSTKCGLPYLS